LLRAPVVGLEQTRSDVFNTQHQSQRLDRGFLEAEFLIELFGFFVFCAGKDSS
jgi:hypothetical protein